MIPTSFSSAVGALIETYSEVDTIFTPAFPSELSIEYAEDNFAAYNKTHSPVKPEKITKLAKKSPKTQMKKNLTNKRGKT